MRLEELRHPVEIGDFAKMFDKPNINTRVQSQAARKNPAWKKTLVTMMRKYGFELVGAGVNGAVFQNPKYDYVLKVYREDKMFDEWVHFCRTHSSNKYVPRFKGSAIKLNSVFKAIRIEPLLPCNTSDANALIDRIQSVMDMPYPRRVEVKETEPDLFYVAQFMVDWEPVYDLTAHNVMARSNGDLVIIDPIYMEPGQFIDW